MIYYGLQRDLAHHAKRPLEEADAISNLTVVALDEEDWAKCIELADTALAILHHGLERSDLLLFEQIVHLLFVYYLCLQTKSSVVLPVA